jgi:Zn finger protein HypA/HybF involved in hydrogenase expression
VQGLRAAVRASALRLALPGCESREFDLVAGNELLVSEIEME